MPTSSQQQGKKQGRQGKSKSPNNTAKASGAKTKKSKASTVRVILLGLSGTGKSTFINQATGSTLAVSDGLKSCTSKVQESGPFYFNGRWVTLVDTPGFDDTDMPNPDVLQMIADYLMGLRKQKKPLSGIIYMHRISDVRIGGTSNRSLKMLGALCGDTALSNVAIVTTMWANVPTDVAEARFRELKSHENVAPILSKGGQLKKHDNNTPSSHAILNWFLDKKACTLQIQQELAKGKPDILLTTAGMELDKEMAASEERFRRQLADLKREVGEATTSSNQALAEELSQASREIEANIEKLQKDRKQMSKGQTKELAKAKGDVRNAQRELARMRKVNARQERRLKASGSLFQRLCCMSAQHMDDSETTMREKERTASPSHMPETASGRNNAV